MFCKFDIVSTVFDVVAMKKRFESCSPVCAIYKTLYLNFVLLK